MCKTKEKRRNHAIIETLLCRNLRGLKRLSAMKEYEVIHEIFNQCPGNKTRDQFIEEIEMEEAPEEWIRKKFKNEKELQIEKIEKEDGSLVFDVMTAMIHQRYTISEI